MHPIHQWREVQEWLRLNKIYQGLRCESRPRYVFIGKDGFWYAKHRPKAKTISVFYMGAKGFGRYQFPVIMGGSPASYYVSTDDGNDSYNGNYPTFQGGSDGPWLTVAKVNGESFIAGDTIDFNCGNSWSGTTLVPPSSGSAVAYIDFGNYGSGALPIIDGIGDESHTIDFRAVSYVRVRDLDLMLTNNNGESHVVIFRGASYCVLLDCEISKGGWGGVYMVDVPFGGGATTTHHNTVQGCEIYDVPHEGIYFGNLTSGNGVSNNRAINNYIHDYVDEAFQIYYESPATTGAHDCIFSQNICDGHGDVGSAHLQGCDGLLLDRNIFYGAGNGVYGVIHATLADDVIISNNLIYKMTLTFGFSLAGIYHSSGDNVRIHHNTIYGISNDGAGDGYGIFANSATSGAEWKYNIVSGCDNQMGWNNAPTTVDYNCIYGTTDQTGTNAITSDPEFLDISGNNYHLQSDSPCISVATGQLVTLDLDGVPRNRGSSNDIGCYESLKGGPRRL